MRERSVSITNTRQFVFNEGVVFDQNHQREEVSFHTQDLEILFEKKDAGWTFKRTPEGFLVRAPETWLVDATDPYKIISFPNPTCNLAYYRYLKTLAESGALADIADFVVANKGLHGFDYHLLTGPALESEIRVAGSDNRVLDFKEGLFDIATETDEYKIVLADTEEFLQNPRELDSNKVSIENAPIDVYSFFQLLRQHYSIFDQFKKADFFNPLYLPDLFKDVPNFDVYVFVPWSCFRYISSFVNQGNRDRVMFWEAHTNEHQTCTFKYLATDKDLGGKKVLVIDNAYTGNTLNKVRDLVESEGGKASRLALFPKSRLSVSNSEYILFIDKIIRSDGINLANDDWIINTYKRILREAECRLFDPEIYGITGSAQQGKPSSKRPLRRNG